MVSKRMSDATQDKVLPSATPTEEDIRAWADLPREEQLRRLRALLAHSDCGTAIPDTVQDVLAEARSRAASRRG